ncbi:MAG: hypothetical protein AB1666_12420 [Pseudomonadota bacterium]|uniref:Uncharacterized protein n=1 Tax=Caldimonas aquatica TaxID=376175 RepID=A0ABY6MRJ0_9BURK|nr:hypothetical protein [Schlegelella aquatica]UZD54620.1 hypothetical protein OMP39_13300 [Schlegelella aquatica]
MDDVLQRGEWIERYAARLLARRPALPSAAALDRARIAWACGAGRLEPERAADEELRRESEAEASA